MMNRNLVCTVGISLALVAICRYDVASAQLGEQLYERKCGRCHAAVAPDEYSPDEWPGVVRSMTAQAALSRQEYGQIVEYLVDSRAEGDEAPSSGGPTVGGYLYTEYFQTQEKTKNYDLHYLALHVSGWISDSIHYLGEFELEHGGTGGTNTFVEQAYLEYWFLPNLGLRIGAMLTPFNRFDEFHDPLSNYTITRPQVSREIGVSAWKDVGVDLRGFLNLNKRASLTYDFYSINGLGNGPNLRGSRQYRDNNEGKAFGGRLNLIYLDLLEMGASAYRGAWDDAGELGLTLLGAHVLARTPAVELYGEYARATSKNPTPSKNGSMSGFFIQASRLFGSRFRPTIRYGQLDYLDEGNTLGRSATKGDKDLREIALSVGYYPHQKVVFKAEYTAFDEGERVQNKANNQFGLQAAVRF